MSRPQPERPAAVVVGGRLGGLGAVRSLGRMGLRVIAVSEQPRDVALASRFAEPRVTPSLHGRTLVDCLLGLRAATPEGAVLVFSSDAPMLAASAHREELAGHFRFQLPPHDLLLRLQSKEGFHQLAAAHGFPAPTTLIVRRLADLEPLAGMMPPFAVKPTGRIPAYDALFAKAYRASTAEEARRLCRRMLEVIDAVVVQEWIEGGSDAIYFNSQYIGRDGALSFTGRKLRSWPPLVGLTASCTAGEEAAAVLAPLTAAFARAVGLDRGLVSMEYKQDSRSGRFLMVEPTIARTNWQEEIATLCGVNLPLAAYADALGLPLPEPRLDPGHVWRNELVDRASAWVGDQPYGMPPGRRVHNAHWRWDDPKPVWAALSRKAAKAWRRVFTLP